MRELAAVALLSLSMAAAGQGPGPLVPFGWNGYPEASGEPMVNPASLGFARGFELGIGASVSDSAFQGVDRVTLTVPGSWLSGWWEDDLGMRRFETAGGVSILGGTLALGAGYTWLDPTAPGSPWEGKDAWTLGLLTRPSRFLSIGLVRREGLDLPGEPSSATIGGGVAVRPVGDRLTLSLDLETDDDLGSAELGGGLEAWPLKGLALRLGVTESRVDAGLELHMGRVSLAESGTADAEIDPIGGRAVLRFSSEQGPDLFDCGPRVVRIELEETPELRARPFLGDVSPCFTDLAVMLSRMREDPRVEAVLLEVSGGAGSLAQLEELRAGLGRLRDSGRGVYVYLVSGGTGPYYLASCADRIWMHPAGRVSFTGLSSTTFFLRELLDRLGIYPDLLHVGEYKSASDMLTRSDMSDEQREATTAMLEAMQAEMVTGVAGGRGLEPAQLDLVMRSGPYAAEGAVSTALVDGICYSDEVEERLRAELGHSPAIVSLEDYAAALPAEDAWGPREHVAVVVATGYIEQGESGTLFPFGRTMGSETVREMLETAASTPGVRAIVLRIDSGGGDALASDDMHHAVGRVMERGVPVIVSMGGAAASGGYYMACGAERVFADAMTVTGSIGVITGKLSWGGLLDSLGVNVVEIATGERAGMYSPYDRFSEEERELSHDLMMESYQLFVETVAEGRDMTVEEVDEVGRGRVWAGSDAAELGLVDEVGGVVDAISYAASVSGMRERETPDVVVYPTPPFPGALGLPGGGALPAGLRGLLDPDTGIGTRYLGLP